MYPNARCRTHHRQLQAVRHIFLFHNRGIPAASSDILFYEVASPAQSEGAQTFS